MKLITLAAAKAIIRGAQKTIKFMDKQQLNGEPQTDIVANALRRAKGQLTIAEGIALQKWFDELQINPYNK